MNARTSLPLLVLSLLAAATAAPAQQSAIPNLGAMGGGQTGYDLINQTAMLGGDYSANDHMQMQQWFEDAKKRGDIVVWNPDKSTWRELNGVMVPTQFGQIFGNDISYTDGVRKQSSIPRPVTAAELQAAAPMIADVRQSMIETHYGVCSPGFVGPPPPGVDCDRFKELTDALAKTDPVALQLQNSQAAQWTGATNASRGAGNEKGAGGMGIMAAGGNDGSSSSSGGDKSTPTPTPDPNPSRPGGDLARSGGDGGDGAYDDGSDIGGDSGQVSGDTGAVATGGDGGGRSTGQGSGGDGRKSAIKISGNQAVAEHTQKYGDGYTFQAVDRAAQAGTRIIDETAESFGADNAEKEAAQKAPPVRYGTMKITPGNQ